MADHFKLQTPSGEVHGEIRTGSPMVVFSHGFGVERTSASMFSDIVASLPTHFGYILFDYSDISDSIWTIPSLTNMREKLFAAVNKAKEIADDTILICHSLGCSVAALVDTDMPVIFLAPPTRSIVVNWKAAFVHKRKDRATVDHLGNVHLIRKSDSQKMIITNEWFEEMVSIPTFPGMEKLAKNGQLDIIEAQSDADIKDRRRYKTLQATGARLITLPGSHNFDPPHRQSLINALHKIIAA